MGRLIDEDVFKTLLNEQLSYGAEDVVAAVYAALQDTQTVDAVEVVRCGKCRIYEPIYDGIGKCPFLIGTNQYKTDNGFCNLGEPKEGDE